MNNYFSSAESLLQSRAASAWTQYVQATEALEIIKSLHSLMEGRELDEEQQKLLRVVSKSLAPIIQALHNNWPLQKADVKDLGDRAEALKNSLRKQPPLKKH